MCLGVSAVSYLNRVTYKSYTEAQRLTPFRAAVGKKHCVCRTFVRRSSTAAAAGQNHFK